MNTFWWKVVGVSNGRLGNIGCVVQRSTGGWGSSSYRTLIYISMLMGKQAWRLLVDALPPPW